MKDESLKTEAVTSANVLIPEQESVFGKMVKVVEKYNSFKSFETTNTVVFQNKETPTEVLTQVELFAACESGKNAGDYEPVVVTVNPIAELKELIFGTGSGFKKPSDLTALIATLEKACLLACGFKTSGKTEPVVKKEKGKKSDFEKSKNAINAKLYKAEKEGTEDEVAKLRLERVQLYIAKDVEPRSSFKDYNLWLTESQKVAAPKTETV